MRLILLSSICVLIVCGKHETCDEDITKEREEDLKQHGCRSCTPLLLEASANCPKTGYECDFEQVTTSNVLGKSCECSHLRCASPNATLAVGGAVVGRLRCADQNWMTRTDEVVVSGVCARKCGHGVCKTTTLVDDPLYEAMTIHQSDNTHPCAWGSCEGGAVGSTGAIEVSYDGPAEFSCSGDGMWNGSDGKKHDTVKCLRIIECELLKVWDSAECYAERQSYCVDPIEPPTKEFLCPTSTFLFFHSNDNDHFPKSIKCVKGEWIYDMGNEGQATQEEFDERYPREDQKFSCMSFVPPSF